MLDIKEMEYVAEVFSKLNFNEFDVQDQLVYISLVNDLMEYQKDMIAKYAYKNSVKFLIKL